MKKDLPTVREVLVYRLSESWVGSLSSSIASEFSQLAIMCKNPSGCTDGRTEGEGACGFAFG